LLEQEKRHARLAVGLMSGTSLDGIDAALVRLSGLSQKPRIRLLAFVTLPYPPAVRKGLLRVAGGEPTTASEISELNFLLGELFAQAALRVCERAHVRPKRLTVIGSHGQTIFHQGHQGIERHKTWSQGAHWPSIPSTLQIGEPAIIAARTGATVVADFRPADISAGGQGAPLVPLLDYLAFRDSKQNTIALNLGGIANLTVIPAGAGLKGVSGFDTGPGNMVIDGLVRHFTGGRENYDRGGRRAAEGKVIEPLLVKLLRLPFFRVPPPKSAGREQFGREFLTRYFLRLGKADLRDLLRTAVELTARTVAEALERFALPRFKPQSHETRLIVSGGGAHNRLLIRRLRELLPHTRVEFSNHYGLPVDAKEAMAFALLADRTLQGLFGNLPSVTGARRAAILGKTTQVMPR